MTGGDFYEAVESHSRQQRLGDVHFRNVAGTVPQYRETFIDDRAIDMIRVLSILHRKWLRRGADPRSHSADHLRCPMACRYGACARMHAGSAGEHRARLWAAARAWEIRQWQAVAVIVDCHQHCVAPAGMMHDRIMRSSLPFVRGLIACARVVRRICAPWSVPPNGTLQDLQVEGKFHERPSIAVSSNFRYCLTGSTRLGSNN